MTKNLARASAKSVKPWIVVCSSGKEHPLKTIRDRSDARNWVIHLNIVRKAPCGPHRSKFCGRTSAKSKMP